MNDRALRLLIADDHPIVRAGLRLVLASQAGWQICAEAENGAELIELASRHEPDIAIVDYALPILNGVEATRQLRKAAPKTRVLIYTMHDDDALIRDALQAGARGYLLKSEGDDQLVAAVRTVAGGKTHFSQQMGECLLDDFLGARKGMMPQVLTTREREVVQLVAEGESNKIIAGRLGLSIKTVDSHRTAAMRKLNLRSAVELTRYAIKNKIIQP